jgi:shikimate kinase
MVKSNIVLIGMPGAGKSTIGVVLAKLRGMRFIDTDLVIQEHTAQLLSETIEQRGVDVFTSLENTIVSQIDVSHTVIATGGSVVYGSQAMRHLAEKGTIVFVDCGFDELSRRLGSLEHRGVVLREGQDLRALYEERLPLYHRYAELTVDVTDLDVRQAVLAISERLC